jgi:hypothetical protein
MEADEHGPSWFETASKPAGTPPPMPPLSLRRSPRPDRVWSMPPGAAAALMNMSASTSSASASESHSPPGVHSARQHQAGGHPPANGTLQRSVSQTLSAPTPSRLPALHAFHASPHATQARLQTSFESTRAAATEASPLQGLMQRHATQQPLPLAFVTSADVSEPPRNILSSTFALHHHRKNRACADRAARGLRQPHHNNKWSTRTVSLCRPRQARPWSAPPTRRLPTAAG